MSLNTESPRPGLATSVLVMRDGGSGPEVLMARRRTDMRFLGGFWVFPGGSLDAVDATIPTTDPCGTGCQFERVLYAAAARELLEEVGLQVPRKEGAVDTEQLYPWARWITPSRAKRRYDTHFFLMSLPPAQEPRCDDSEIGEVCWIQPKDWAFGAFLEEFPIAPPTQLILRELAEELEAHPSLHELLRAARLREIRSVMPKLHPSQPGLVVLPWDAEYPQLAGEALLWDAAAIAERSSWPGRLSASRDIQKISQ